MEATTISRSLFSPSAVSQPSPSPSLSSPKLAASLSINSTLQTQKERPLSISPLMKSSRCLLNCSPIAAFETEPETPIEKRFAAFPTVMDINQIREILPHSANLTFLIYFPSPSVHKLVIHSM